MKDIVTIPAEANSQEKSILRGNFYIDVEHSCSACSYYDTQEDCEVCFGEINYTQRHAVPWDTIKEIRASLVNIYK